MTTQPPVDDRAFEDDELSERKLVLDCDATKSLSLPYGKLTALFMLASPVAPGMYSNIQNKEIEPIERMRLLPCVDRDLHFPVSRV
ncbi:MAG: hypothetical protein AAFU80_02480 [Pseudomonadota bacterium]